MKRKFVTTIFLVLLVTVSAVSVLHFYFMAEERLRLIDQQLEASASLLLTSNLPKLTFEDLEQVESYLYEILGSQRSNKLILIKNQRGRVIFSSRNARWLLEDLPEEPKWQTVTVEGHRLRLLAVKVPQVKKTLQIAMILDTELFYWRQLDAIFVLYVLSALLLVLAVTFFLARALLRPLGHLADYLNFVSQQFDEGFRNTPRISPELRVAGYGPKDEFWSLTKAAAKLTEKIGRNMKLMRSWTAQMAHELKTPLTILRNLLDEETKGSPGSREARVREATAQLDRLDHVISSFLEWASVENSSSQSGELTAIPLAPLVRGVIGRLEPLCPGRLEVVVAASPTLFGSPALVEQAITNLVSNALKYSPPESKVIVRVERDRIVVQDKGAGIPPVVLEKLGQPFNFHRQDGNGGKGTGLGLAWVSTICRKYGWRLEVKSTPSGSTVTVAGF